MDCPKDLSTLALDNLCLIANCLMSLIELVMPDAEALGSVDEVLAARDIVERGTSADRQRRTFDASLAQRMSSKEALNAVVDGLIAEDGRRPIEPAKLNLRTPQEGVACRLQRRRKPPGAQHSSIEAR